MPATRVFLDVDIGDAAAHAGATVEWERACSYLEACGAQLGLSPPLTSLDPDAAALLLEAYESDKAWRSRGPARVTPPPPLRAGRLVVELCDAAPKAAENFRCLCTGEKGAGKGSGKPLCYAGAPFHRVVSGFVAQGGDVVRCDGGGCDSIYGGKFKDEAGGLAGKHDAAGVVGMANRGKHGNGCQFYVTLAPAPALDGKHVVVGRVVEGFEVLERLSADVASADGAPRAAAVVAACGQLNSE